MVFETSTHNRIHQLPSLRIWRQPDKGLTSVSVPILAIGLTAAWRHHPPFTCGGLEFGDSLLIQEKASIPKLGNASCHRIRNDTARLQRCCN